MTGIGARTPFVGRERELATLLARLDAAGRGDGGVALVAGEPGIGKTRLLAELAERARTDGWTALWGRAYETEGMPPYLPFIEALREQIRTCPADALRVDLGAGAQEVALLVPELRVRLPDLALAPAVSPDQERYRLFESVCDFLFAVAARSQKPTGARGLLLILDDLHWADRANLLLLLHLARRLAGAPVLLAAAYRAEEVGQVGPLQEVLAGLSREGEPLRLALTAFTPGEVASLIHESAGVAPAPDVVTAIHRETDGNAFFTREVVRDLLAQGRDLGAPGAVPSAWRVPEGVRHVIGQRLALLSTQANQVLQAAAVLGDGFTFDVLQAASGIAFAPLMEALEEALAAGMLREEGEGYHFAHALIRRTLYDGLSLTRRQWLHLKAADALEQTARGETPRHLVALAGHYRLAGATAGPAKVLAAARRAAEAAETVYGWEEAAAHWQVALDVLDDQGTPDPAARCDLLLALGKALLSAGEPQRVFESITPDAFALAEALDDSQRASHACQLALKALNNYGWSTMLGTPEYRLWAERADRYAAPGTIDRAHADIALKDVLLGGREFAETRVLTWRALNLARELGDPETLFTAALQVLGVFWAPEQQEEQHRLTREVLTLPRTGVSARTLCRVLWVSGNLLFVWGDRESAERLWQEVAGIAARTQDSFLLLFPSFVECWLAAHTEDPRTALGAADRLVARSAELGSPAAGHTFARAWTLRQLLHLGRTEEAMAPATWFHMAPSTRCLTLAHAGRFKEARAVLDQSTQELRLTRAHNDTWTIFLLAFLEAAVLLEDRATATALASRLARVAHLADNFTCVARHLGAACALLGERAQSRVYYQQALAVATRIGFRTELALTHLGLAELLAGEPGGRAEARTHLDIALSECARMEMQPALLRARRLDERLGMAAQRSAIAYPDGLSEREVEVLRLIAAGKSNKAIAEVLVISLNTVFRHVNHILQKTGAANRTEAAAYAIRHGLTAQD